MEEHNLKEIKQGTARYLPGDLSSKSWGIQVIDAGYTHIPAHSPYPLSHHPNSYHFSWDHGRILNEYQLVFISSGTGVFESKESGLHSLKSGNAFLLFPGEWHRFKPQFEGGWFEHWVGFKGEYAARLMTYLFAPEKPIFDIGNDREFLHLLAQVEHAIEDQFIEAQELLCGYTLALIGRLRYIQEQNIWQGMKQQDPITVARHHILEHFTKEIDLQNLSKELGMSYSSFRSQFKMRTGYSPKQFQIQIRLNKAQDMLLKTNHSVSKIAEETGFRSLYHFSNSFTEKLGINPSQFRKINQP